jgi:hypothetical protein
MRGWFGMLALLAFGLVATCARGATAKPSQDLMQRLPLEVFSAISVEDAAALRQSPLGVAVTQWMAQPEALPQTQRAWGLFAGRLGVTEAEAFDGLLGGSAVLAFARRDAQAPVDWIVLAAVGSAMDVRMVRRTRAVPRKIVHGRAVLGLEEESFLLATLPPMNDGRSVLALAPAGAEWLLVRTLAVSAGKAEMLMGDPLQGAPADAPVRGFWRPPGIGAASGDLERVLWAPGEPAHTLSIWARARDTSIDIGFRPITGGQEAAEPTIGVPGVLLDLTGPGQAIVSGVLERAGLAGAMPEGLSVSREPGTLVVRSGSEGIELGARLPLASASSLANSPGDRPIVSLRQARVRELSETAASRAIFGPRAQLAWTVLDEEAGRAELLLAVTAGAAEDDAASPAGDGSEGRSVKIIAEAISQPPPERPGIHGSARPHALWLLLRPAGEGASGVAGSGFASLASLVERAWWAVESASGAVRGRIVLELREVGGG